MADDIFAKKSGSLMGTLYGSSSESAAPVKLLAPPKRIAVPSKATSGSNMDAAAKAAAAKAAAAKIAALAPSLNMEAIAASVAAAKNSLQQASNVQSAAAKEAAAQAAKEKALDNEEYDPSKPNDYDEICKRRAREKAEKEMQNRITAEQGKARLRSLGLDPDAPPPKEETVAEKLMKKMGYKAGQGLGKEEQGIAAPVIHQKMGGGQGVVKLGNTVEPPAKRIRPSAPTRILLLTNLVGKGEVDDDLADETAEEAKKYGNLDASGCKVVEVHNAPDDQAVRVFLAFRESAGATKALEDMNGRYFGGRVVRARYYSEDRWKQGDLQPAAGE
mmetsp:Transcript_48723/g.104398  ORF Transcript_48723/g.104398 Transcript_48723/m.104398 type:complete len:331 (-) Transcript_48723:107-1099(-)